MPKITFILKDGSRKELEADSGVNAMQVAVFNNIPGIEGACGGFCSCATCHTYVESQHTPPPMAEDEDGMLDGVAAKRNRKTSRLACQIMLSPELDGLVLRVPEKQ